jgi:hypothetical protein
LRDYVGFFLAFNERMAMATTKDTLDDREAKYGSWPVNALCAQTLKEVARNTPNWGKLQPHQRESIDMICTKIGRLLCGDPNSIDSWHDIGGYALLSEREIKSPAAVVVKKR